MKKTKKITEYDTEIVYPHGTPLTRRDMLRAGAIQFSAAMTLPTIYEWMARAGFAEAQTAECGTNTGSTMPVFVQLALAGGASIMSNYIPRTLEGAMLPTYNLIGLGAPSLLTRTTEFGNRVEFPATSGLIIGMRTEATPVTLLNTAFAAVPVRLQDDSAMNQIDPTGAITRAGAKGNSLPNLGSMGSATGGRHLPAFVPPPAPLVVQSYADLAAAISVAGALGELSPSQKPALFRLMNRLTTTQARTLAGMSAAEQISTLTKCASGVNQTLVSSGSSGTNPTDDPAVANVWNITAADVANNPGNQDVVFASMLYNALRGNAGTINLTLGGYDYHGNARNATNARDNQAGVVVGRILQTAAVMRKPLFLMISTDGAVGSPMSDSSAVSYTSDRGSGSGMMMIAYHPTRVPTATGFQIGGMSTGQAADERFITGASGPHAAAAVVANYLNFAGKVGMLDSVIPRAFSPDQLAQVIKIG